MRYSATAIFFRSALAALPLVRYSATTIFSIVHTRGQYIGKYLPLGGGKKYQPMSFAGKIWKGEEKKGENLTEKDRKGKEKWRKGNENEDIS